MKRSVVNKKISMMLVACIVCLCLNNIAQAQIKKTEQITSPEFFSSENFKVFNRNVTVSKDQNQKPVVHLDSKPGNGVAWVNNITFNTGIIEFDVKGRNLMQQSFVGIAFHGANDSSYDAVYFRPFNFQSADTTRKNHSVQYISMPQYDWSFLREKFPGKYENKLLNGVDPDSWFHAKIVVAKESITVFVNGADKPSLTVKPLNNYAMGNIGFWTGNNSDGDFKNLVIKKEQ